MNLTFKINQLPSVNMGSESLEICAICLSKLEQGKKLLCGHVFHESCLLRLIQEFSVDKKCPQCREPIIFNTELSQAIQEMKIGKSVGSVINKAKSIQNSLSAYHYDLRSHRAKMIKDNRDVFQEDQKKNEFQENLQ